MEKIVNLKNVLSKIKLICWDLDGTLFDTENMWYNMDSLIKEKYGADLEKEKYGKASEEIAAIAYKTWGYRANADKALNYFKESSMLQIIINKCDLTNKTVLNNKIVNELFSFEKFDAIVSESSFSEKFIDEDLYKKALEIAGICDCEEAVAICDMPFELKCAKNCGLVTIWAKNKDYPFTNDELKEIENYADFYVEDFSDLI